MPTDYGFDSYGYKIIFLLAVYLTCSEELYNCFLKRNMTLRIWTLNQYIGYFFRLVETEVQICYTQNYMFSFTVKGKYIILSKF